MTRSKPRKQAAVRRCRYFPVVEPLESRRLLALQPGWPSFWNNTVGAVLDDADDVVSFQYLDAVTVRLTVNGTNYDYSRAQVQYLQVSGNGGNDQIVVASDVTLQCRISGGNGDDSIVGGAGDDGIVGDLGNDTLIGGAGDDNLQAWDPYWGYVDSWGNGVGGPPPPSVSSDSVLGGDGDDFIWGSPGRDTIDGGAGTNGTDPVSSYEVQVVMGYFGDDDGFVSHDDVITLSFPDANTARVTMNGVSYDFDRAYVNGFVVDAGDGNDLVTVDSSVNVPVRLYGSVGNDTLIGSSGNDSLEGGPGNDSLVGNDGNDSLFGEEGNDTLAGGNGNDSLDGGPGYDSLMGGPGNDTLCGQMGNDTLDGGGGDDDIVLILGSTDYVVDSSGNDTLDFSPTGRGITIDLSLNTGQRQNADAAGNGVILVGQFENVIGSRFDDWITGNALVNRLEGGAGNDTLDGGGGDRDLFGKGDGSKPDRSAKPGTDGDVLIGGEGNDWLDGGRGRDNLDGGAGDDTLVADPLVDNVNGGPGSNRIILVTKDPGDASLLGLIEAPTGIFFDLATGTLVVRGDADGPSDDQIAVAAGASGWLEITLNGVEYSADPLSPQYTETLAGASIFSVFSLRVRGAQGNDTLAVTAFFMDTHIVLAGGAGDDLVMGGDNAEVLRGGRGNDTLLGMAGDDVLFGGRGNDLLDGGAGFDWANYTGAPEPVDVDLIKGLARGDGLDRLAGIDAAFGWLLTTEKV